MYTPAFNREERAEVLAAAIRDIHFATLVTPSAEGIKVTHLPMMPRETAGGLVLEGHMARQNDHGAALGTSVAIFQGPQAYVSPSWYEAKREHGKVVPTWNYVTIHAHGMLERIDDPDWLLGHLNALTDLNEAGRADAWAVADAPADFVATLLRAIFGVRLAVERLEGKWKMSQNRPAADREGTIAGLAASAKLGDREVAAAMRALEAARSAAPVL